MSDDRALLHTALLEAYPDYVSLEQLVDFNCQVKIRSFVPDTKGQSDVIYAVIKDAVSKGWLKNLILAAAAARPKNEDIARLARTLTDGPSAHLSSGFRIAAPPQQTVETRSPSSDSFGNETSRFVATISDGFTSVQDHVDGGLNLAGIGNVGRTTLDRRDVCNDMLDPLQVGALEKRLEQLNEEYIAASSQIGSSLSDRDRLILDRQAQSIQQERLKVMAMLRDENSE